MGQNYKMILQYEGTRYDGWQKQGNTERTIQGRLEAVLTRMVGTEVEVHGSGRTDAGVHAMGQVANVHLPKKFEPSAVMEYLNEYLPEDIGILSVEYADGRFHSRLNATKKTYRYQIATHQKRDVFARRMQYHLGKELDLTAMRQAAELLCGTHDYRSFCGNKKMKKSTVRTIYAIWISQDVQTGVITLDVTGNGFLQHMIRILAGTLIEVGLGMRDASSMEEILAAKDRQAAGFTAPAEGLCLMEVCYD